MLARTITAGSIIGLLGLSALPAASHAQCTAAEGSWSSIFDWEDKINLASCGVGGSSTEFEFSHAALLPQGDFRGTVLLWRKEVMQQGPEPCLEADTPRAWIFRPDYPNVLLKVQQALSSDIFCGGQTFDKHGQLIVCGGITKESGCPPDCDFPVETYRFRPQLLEMGGLTPGGAGTVFGNPWKQLGDMAIRRYYPTTLSLLRYPTFRSTAPSGLPAGQQLDGGSVLVAGGPTFRWPEEPCEPPNCEPSGADGNEYWELIPPALGGAATNWYAPFLPLGADPVVGPPDPPTGVDAYYGRTASPMWPYGESTNPNWNKNSPHYFAFPVSAYDGYGRPQTTGTPPYADRLFDSYPRMFQTSVAGHILVVGDVDTGEPAANEPGATWVIKPRISTTGSLSRWESHLAPRGIPVSSGVWHDSHYDTSLLMHDLQAGSPKHDRILMFGGSRFNGTAWEVNDTIWEFEPSEIGDPIVDGTWEAKRTDTQFERIFPNAVILPTGEIFIEGGDRRDTFGSHQGGASDPVYAPVIYDPGIDKDDPGMLYPQNPDGVLMPRLYHHVAVLLPDASVFIAGGQRRKDVNGVSVPSSSSGMEPDPRFNGEIFYPPYFNSGRARPVIMSWQSDISFSDNFTLNEFTVQVDKSTDGTIDSIVLLRPAAITHHYDNDQRFVELAFSQQGLPVPGDPGRELVTLDVEAPHEKLGPPGYYLLFAIEAHNGCTDVQGHRVPTRAKFIQIL